MLQIHWIIFSKPSNKPIKFNSIIKSFLEGYSKTKKAILVTLEKHFFCISLICAYLNTSSVRITSFKNNLKVPFKALATLSARCYMQDATEKHIW